MRTAIMIVSAALIPALLFLLFAAFCLLTTSEFPPRIHYDLPPFHAGNAVTAGVLLR